MINAHFKAHENKNNAQLKAHYLLLIVCIILTSFFFSPKRLCLSARGMLSCYFVNNPLEGYRTLEEKQNHFKSPSPTNPSANKGGNGKVTS